MKLGFFTAAFPGKSLEEVAVWAAENDFDTLEIACWPLEKAARRYAGITTVDVTILMPPQPGKFTLFLITTG